METMRTFIAIELPQPLRDALAVAQRALQSADAAAARSVKWVDAGSIHLTLKYLGETPVTQLEAIRAGMTQLAAGRRPIELGLGAAGCFPNGRQPRVLWIGLGGEVEALAALQAAVEAAVSPLGFPAEARRFSPHLTLGRVRDEALPEMRQRLGTAILALRPPAVSFVATSVSHMRSDLRPTGAVYTCLAEVSLGQE